MKKKSRTVQIGLRLERDLLHDVEFLAEHEGIDKMSFIRRALAGFVSEAQDAFEDAAIEDYIRLRIDKKQLKEFTNLKDVPKDIQEARQETLKAITKKRMKR